MSTSLPVLGPPPSTVAAQNPNNAKQNEIVNLANTIAENTKIYDDYFVENNLPTPSHGLETPASINLPPRIQKARETVMDASTELQALILGPVLHVHNETFQHANLVSLHGLYHWGLSTALKVGEEITFAEMARRVGQPEHDVRRILLFCMTKHIFIQPRKGYVAHTASSKMLSEMEIMRDWIGLVTEEMWPCAPRVIEALKRWPGSNEPHQTAYSIAHGVPMSVFGYLNHHPWRARRFANAMSFFNSDPDLAPYHLFTAFDWKKTNVFVDVGGSLGDTAINLAKREPHMKCVTQDQAGLAREATANIPVELKSRVSFQEHSFFNDQPYHGADIYHFRWIFHNWSDKYCRRILQALIPALKPGARVIVSDFVIPPLGASSAYAEWSVRAFDIAMLELFNAKEREPEDWHNLFTSADHRYKVTAIKNPPNCKLAFIEATWFPESTESTESSS